MKGKWTDGEFMPETDPPTYNSEANVYQRAIVQYPKNEHSRIIPGFAFGETAEECTANAWMLASAKDLCRAVQLFLKGDPNATEFAEKVMIKAMGHYETHSNATTG